MAAYAALNSVINILQQIQQHPRPPITIEKQHLDSLCEVISFLQDFLENYSLRDIGDGKEALETQIADAAYAAEDIIESHIVDQISSFHEQNNCINLFFSGVKKVITTLACFPNHETYQILTGDGERSSNSLFCQDLQKVIEYMKIIKKEVIEIQEKMRGINDDELPRNIISISSNITGSSTLPPPKRKNRNTNTMVVLDDVLIQIMDRLTGHLPNRQVLPIVGMGGIGKTTLARHVYDNPTIVEHFHIRVWITISQEYRLRDVLLEALSCVNKSYQKDENKSSEDELGSQLYRSLCGRKYLIILDDVWSIEAWEKLMLLFPDNNNGSRIMITTRLANVSNHFGSCGFKMKFLDEEKSWDLFCKIVFPQDPFCPPELEEIGKKIARNCKGLPLSISVIGGLLANSEKTLQHWEYIAENVNPVINLEDDMHCLNILYLSYYHLPIHLKPCFLYLGVFHKDTRIAVSSLIRLWVAEGFLKPIAAKSLEVVAEEYLKDLIDRNLILVSQWGSSTGKVKYCRIHDLLRDLCIREAKKDKFLWVSEVHDFDNLEGIQSQRRISLHKGTLKRECHIDRVREAVPLQSLARSLTCHFKDVRLLSRSYRLVRVFTVERHYAYCCGKTKRRYSLKDVLKFVNSRYFDVGPGLKLTSIPPSIHHLWNLQTVILKTTRFTFHVPPEIWEMSQLRHLEIRGHFSLPDRPKVPLIHEGDDDDFILRNLHTIKRVRNLKLSEEVITRIPNVKKLQLCYHVKRRVAHNYCLNNLGLLNKLESLLISYERRPSFLQNFDFPHSLKKLTLYRTNLLSEDMRMIGSLPHLEVLKLRYSSFRGPEWNPVEGEFLCLKFLLIQCCNDLVCWNANTTHFPCLEKLVLGRLRNLKEIPLDMGEIPTLRSIKLLYCSDSSVMSAKNILDEQVELGNDDLQVRVVVCEKDAQLERLATHNFQVKAHDSHCFRCSHREVYS